MKIITLSRACSFVLLTVVSAIAPVGLTDAFAAAPMVKQSAPGYYRIMLGDFEVTALSDGTVALPMNKLLTRTTPDKVDRALAKSFLKSPVETSVNAYLINTGKKLVLVDCGAAGLFGPTLGNLAANLKAAGYQPEQIDDVLLTHMHSDHLGGLSNNGQPVFPNARIHVDKQEADFWLSQENLNKAPEEAKVFFKNAMSTLEPYIKSGKLQVFEGNTDIVAGIKAVPDHGHTPGHSEYLVESNGQKLMLWGDVIHVAAVQFGQPEIAIQFDTDSNSAVAARKKAFAEAAKQGYWVAGAHLPFPGIGHVRSEGKGYAWVPVNYSPLR